MDNQNIIRFSETRGAFMAAFFEAKRISAKLQRLAKMTI